MNTWNPNDLGQQTGDLISPDASLRRFKEQTRLIIKEPLPKELAALRIRQEQATTHIVKQVFEYWGTPWEEGAE